MINLDVATVVRIYIYIRDMIRVVALALCPSSFIV